MIKHGPLTKDNAETEIKIIKTIFVPADLKLLSLKISSYNYIPFSVFPKFQTHTGTAIIM